MFTGDQHQILYKFADLIDQLFNAFNFIPQFRKLVTKCFPLETKSIARQLFPEYYKIGNTNIQ